MNENINLVEILKNAPKGTKLWSPLCGDCTLEGIGSGRGESYPITCMALEKDGSEHYEVFSANGAAYTFYAYSECMLFPSKGNRDWSTFKVSKPHKHFEPFQKVLRIDDNNPDYKIWTSDFYSHYEETSGKHYLTSGFINGDDEIMPYNGNEDKVGKVVE